MNNLVKTKDKFLIFYPLFLVLAMIVLFPLLTGALGKTLGYVISYSGYLLLLLLGVIVVRPSLFSKETACLHPVAYYLLAFIPAVATFFAAFLSVVAWLDIVSISIILVYSICNGTLEELFWRGCYNKQFRKRPMLACIYPTVLFSCWHFALVLAKGMQYTGGISALVGGAAIMGIIWCIVAYKTQNIFLVILAHVFTNFFAFSQLVYQNWFT